MRTEQKLTQFCAERPCSESDFPILGISNVHDVIGVWIGSHVRMRNHAKSRQNETQARLETQTSQQGIESVLSDLILSAFAFLLVGLDNDQAAMRNCRIDNRTNFFNERRKPLFHRPRIRILPRDVIGRRHRCIERIISLPNKRHW